MVQIGKTTLNVKILKVMEQDSLMLMKLNIHVKIEILTKKLSGAATGRTMTVMMLPEKQDGTTASGMEKITALTNHGGEMKFLGRLTLNVKITAAMNLRTHNLTVQAMTHGMEIIGAATGPTLIAMRSLEKQDGTIAIGMEKITALTNHGGEMKSLGKLTFGVKKTVAMNLRTHNLTVQAMTHGLVNIGIASGPTLIAMRSLEKKDGITAIGMEKIIVVTITMNHGGVMRLLGRYTLNAKKMVDMSQSIRNLTVRQMIHGLETIGSASGPTPTAMTSLENKDGTIAIGMESHTANKLVQLKVISTITSNVWKRTTTTTVIPWIQLDHTGIATGTEMVVTLLANPKAGMTATGTICVMDSLMILMRQVSIALRNGLRATRSPGTAKMKVESTMTAMHMTLVAKIQNGMIAIGILTVKTMERREQPSMSGLLAIRRHMKIAEMKRACSITATCMKNVLESSMNTGMTVIGMKSTVHFGKIHGEVHIKNSMPGFDAMILKEVAMNVVTQKDYSGLVIWTMFAMMLLILTGILAIGTILTARRIPHMAKMIMMTLPTMEHQAKDSRSGLIAMKPLMTCVTTTGSSIPNTMIVTGITLDAKICIGMTVIGTMKAVNGWKD